jgi:hypothetical protein
MSKRQAHISSQGTRFRTALEAASRNVMANPKLTGLGKLKAAIAFQAALKATGFHQPAFITPKGCGQMLAADLLTAVEAEFEHATEAARMAIGMSAAAAKAMP